MVYYEDCLVRTMIIYNIQGDNMINYDYVYNLSILFVHDY